MEIEHAVSSASCSWALLSRLPCFHLSLDSTPSLRHLIGFFLIAFQLRAAVWVEPAELRPRLFGFSYLQLQGLKNDLLLGGLQLPILETFDISHICSSNVLCQADRECTDEVFLTRSWSLRFLMAVVSAGTISSSLSLLSYFLT